MQREPIDRDQLLFERMQRINRLQAEANEQQAAGPSPFPLWFAGFTSGAVLLAAGAALLKIAG